MEKGTTGEGDVIMIDAIDMTYTITSLQRAELVNNSWSYESSYGKMK